MFTGVIFICNYYMRLKRFTLPKKTESVRRRRLELPGGCARELKCNTIVPCCDCHSARSIGFICFSRSISVVVISSRNDGVRVRSRLWEECLRVDLKIGFAFSNVVRTLCQEYVEQHDIYANDGPKVGNLVRSSIWSCSQTRYVQRNYVGESYCTYTTARTDISLDHGSVTIGPTGRQKHHHVGSS